MQLMFQNRLLRIAPLWRQNACFAQHLITPYHQLFQRFRATAFRRVRQWFCLFNSIYFAFCARKRCICLFLYLYSGNQVGRFPLTLQGDFLLYEQLCISIVPYDPLPHLNAFSIIATDISFLWLYFLRADNQLSRFAFQRHFICKLNK